MEMFEDLQFTHLIKETTEISQNIKQVALLKEIASCNSWGVVLFVQCSSSVSWFTPASKIVFI